MLEPGGAQARASRWTTPLVLLQRSNSKGFVPRLRACPASRDRAALGMTVPFQKCDLKAGSFGRQPQLPRGALLLLRIDKPAVALEDDRPCLRRILPIDYFHALPFQVLVNGEE